MAAVASSQLDQATHDQLCCTYASLILHDDGQEVSAAKISKLVEASSNSIEKYWPILFARTLGGKDLSSLVFATGGSAPVSTGVSAAPVAQVKAEEKKPEAAANKKVDVETEDPVADMNIFGEDDY